MKNKPDKASSRSNRGRSWRAWLLIASGAGLVTTQLQPAQARSTTFQSPTPAPISTVINQPYVTFQTAKASHKLFSLNSDVPVYLVILVLIVLLAAVTIYRSSDWSQH